MLKPPVPREARARNLLPCMALCMALGIVLGRYASLPWPGWAAAAAALAGAVLARDRLRCVCICLCAAALSLPLGYAAFHPVLPAEGLASVTGVITEETNQEGRVRTVLRHVTVNGSPCAGGLYWTAYTDEIPAGVTPGERVSVTARIYHPDRAENPEGFDFREYLLQKGVTAGLYGMEDFRDEGRSMYPDAIAARARRFLEDRFILRMGEDAGRLAAAMLLGSRNMLPQEDRDAFSRLGIAHILAVSGFHVSVLAALLQLALRRIRHRRRLCLAIETALLALYCLLTGFNPPVVRASIMAVLYLIGRMSHRRVSLLHTLSAAAILTLLFRPAALFGASFQLSYSAVLALALIEPTLERALRPREGWRTRLWQGVCAAVSVQIGILLPQLWWFGRLPLLGFPFNVALLFFAPVLLGLMWLAFLCLPVPFLGGAAGLLARFPAEGFLAAVRWLGSSDWLSVSLPRPKLLTVLCLLLLAAALCFRVRLRPLKRLLIAVPALALTAASLVIHLPHQGAQYIQFSVGSADAAILWDQDTVTVIDTGETGEELALFLSARGLSVDTLIITHLHRDHAGGIAGLIAAGIPVRRCLLPEGAGSTRIDDNMLSLLRSLLDEGTAYGTLRRGDTLPLPGGALTVLWPPGSRVRKGADANDYSLVMMLECRGVTMLLTGDITGSYEGYLSEPADLLKVSHHGSASSTSDAFLEAVSPQALVLSCGDLRRHAALRARTEGLPLYATRETGAVLIDFTGGGQYLLHGWLREPLDMPEPSGSDEPAPEE